MYLHKLTDMESKKAVMAQAVVLNAQKDNTSFYGVFASTLFSGGENISPYNNLKKELANDDTEEEYELSEVSTNVENYIKHLEGEKEVTMWEKVWEKYSKSLENADSETKKICFYELCSLVDNKNSKETKEYLAFLSCKLGISDEVADEILYLLISYGAIEADALVLIEQ